MALKRYSALLGLAGLLSLMPLLGQTAEATGPISSYTPAALQAGTPGGVQILSPQEAVNLYNGNLSFVVPLYRVGGRGAAGYTMAVPIGTKWTLENHPNNGQNIFAPTPTVYPVDFLFPDASAGPNRYSPGRIVQRYANVPGDAIYPCNFSGTPGAGFTYFQSPTQTKIVWLEPDGTEHEFLDVLNHGQPLPPQTPTYTCQTDPNVGGPYRGTVFQSTDATAASFVVDPGVYNAGSFLQDTGGSGTGLYDAITTTAKYRHGKGIAGWLLFKDGTRYRSDTSGNITQIVDRLGNTVNIASDSSSYMTITDSLGRSVNVTYQSLSGTPTDTVTETIQYTGATGVGRTINIVYGKLSTHLISGSAMTFAQLFPISNGSGSTFDTWVLTAIVLPDNSQYQFLYNAYGELAQATLPAGGVYQYDWPSAVSGDCTTGGCAVSYSQDDQATGGTQEFAVIRRVLARRVYPSGLSQGLQGQTCYGTGNPVLVTYYGSDASSGCASGTVISKESHTFIGNPQTDIAPPPTFTEVATEGKEITTMLQDSSGNAVKTTNSQWQTDAVNQSQNATECQMNVTLGSSISGLVMTYDQYFNLAGTYEYDYGSAPSVGSSCPGTVPSGWTRQTQNTYIADGVYDVVASTSSPGTDSNHMRNLVSEVDINCPSGSTNCPSSGTWAKTLYGYDNTTSTTRSGVTGWAAPTHSKLGNRTLKQNWLNTTNTYLNTTYYYDVLGNGVQITDPKSNQTYITYNDNCSTSGLSNLFAFPTQVTDPENHVSTIAWDCYIGKQTTFTDMSNGVSTTYSYTGDLFDRLLEAKQAVSKTEETHVAFSYPNLTTVTTKQDQTSLDDGVVQTTVLFDGLGRKVNSERAFGGCWLSVQQTYDAKGRPWAVSLPYNTCSESAHYQTTTYDGANRVYQVLTDDGAGTTTTYSGNIATVTDAALSTRDLTTDGLGRLTSVVEHTSPSNYTTGYLYNVADDLTSVTQGALTRTFTYDSLKRLITAINPESGTTCYGSLSGSTCTENYDNNGNLLSKVDGASVTTNYTYDSMNRLTGKSYTGGVTPTPPVTLTYNGAGSCPNGGTAYNLRRLTSVSTTASGATPSTAETWSYDALGRVCSRSESVGSVSPGSFAYKYNLASGILTETYPSLRAISTSYDVLNRPIGVNGVSTTYANTTGTYYASNDALAQLQLGPPTGTGSGPLATEVFTYDPIRRQPTAITMANSSGQQLGLTYGYCPSGNCAMNNGNVQTAGIVVSAPMSLNLSQSFGYDTLNRVMSAGETGGSSEWSQGYSYDQWGNRAVSSGYIPNGNLTPESTSEFTNNRWSLGTGYSYSGSGNQLSTGTRNSPNVAANLFGYDAENRLLTANMAGTGTVSYAYDGQGRRVQKTVGSTLTTFIYDGAGALAAEYSTGRRARRGRSICWRMR